MEGEVRGEFPSECNVRNASAQQMSWWTEHSSRRKQNSHRGNGVTEAKTAGRENWGSGTLAFSFPSVRGKCMEDILVKKKSQIIIYTGFCCNTEHC